MFGFLFPIKDEGMARTYPLATRSLAALLVLGLAACSSGEDFDAGPSVGSSGASSGAPGDIASEPAAPAPDASPDASPESGESAGDVDAAVGDDAATEAGGATPPEPEGDRTEPSIQAGTLTAGDHDDRLNPEQHRDYANRYLQGAGAATGLPTLDLTRRIEVRVTGAAGAPLSGARVRTAETGLDVPTAADGIAWLHPGIDGLPEPLVLDVSDRFGDVSVRATEPDASGRIDVSLPVQGVAATALDIALVLDTTGSMGDELAWLQAELSSILGRLDPSPELRVALVFYRDDGDAYVVRSHDFTEDVGAAQATIGAEFHDGGGDYPEAMDRALAEALGLGWRADATGVLLLVADAPPHADALRATFDSALAARAAGVHIVPVAASGVADDAQYLMRAMAAVTQSRYLFLTDDSGVGASKPEPDIDCYLVTRLDGLIVRTVQSLATGVRVEPAQEEIIRRVGEYDEGVCG